MFHKKDEASPLLPLPLLMDQEVSVTERKSEREFIYTAVMHLANRTFIIVVFVAAAAVIVIKNIIISIIIIITMVRY